MIFSKEYEKYYIEEMQDAIGLIDFKALDNNNFEVLYYLFPLIERIFIDILKYSIISDIEIYSQGTFRTLESALKKRENLNCFDSETIEVLNTDAEGRMILADAIYYAVSKFDPKIVIDLGSKILKSANEFIDKLENYKMEELEMVA